MNYEVIIGCEVHIQLSTESKAFCSCANLFGGEPNTRVCPVCTGLPGSLPVVNRALIDGAILAGLALNCTVAEVTKFDRKNYIYPDLPKGYQISQFDMPICTDGHLEVETDDGETRRIGIIRLHMEEDTGKNIHADDGRDLSFVDFNRSGTPLLEVVSAPDIRSPQEAVRYVQSIREIVRYLGISDCNMEEASLRCDANINLWVHEEGETYATPIVEVKNMNSFRSIRNALQYEVKRQLSEWKAHRRTLEAEGKSTRGYVDAKGITVLQRSKEESADYRYFPEPDLKPIAIPREYVESLRKRVGELPAEKRLRFLETYHIPERDAFQLAVSPALADYFEATVAEYANPRRAANWLLSEVLKYMNATGTTVPALRVEPDALRELLLAVDAGEVSGKTAKEVFVEMAETGERAGAIIERRGLKQISNESELEEIVKRIIAENESSADDFRAGKSRALKFLMGQVMKATRGKANPQLADRILRDHLRA